MADPTNGDVLFARCVRIEEVVSVAKEARPTAGMRKNQSATRNIEIRYAFTSDRDWLEKIHFPGGCRGHMRGLYRVGIRGASEAVVVRGSIETLTETSYNTRKLAAILNRKALVPCLPR